GQLVATPIVESVQIRGSVAGEPTDNIFFREVELNRRMLFQNVQGGLKPIVKGELRFQGYDGLGFVHGKDGAALRAFPMNCADCHKAVGYLDSMQPIKIPIAGHTNDYSAVSNVIARKLAGRNFNALKKWMSGETSPTK